MGLTEGLVRPRRSAMRDTRRARPRGRCLPWLLPLIVASLPGEVSLPPVFGDHMVLQRDQPVPIWGSALPGEKVSVTFAGETCSTTADEHGYWSVKLTPLPPSAEPRELSVQGRNILRFADVLVGDVWFLSGQSNMEKPLGPRRGQKPTDDHEAELARAASPTLRLFQVPHTGRKKAGDRTLQWGECTADTLVQMEFSAAGYYFGRELTQKLGIPIGLIHSSYGGTRIEAWMPPAAFRSDPVLKPLQHDSYPAWVPGVQPTELYLSMVEPYVPFALRGFLWYQGETNCMNAEHLIYAAKLRALIRTWREAWGIPDAPFYFAQLAPFAYSKQRDWARQLTSLALPAFWEAQMAALDVPHSGLIPTSDLAGAGRDIHPTNKRDVGLRFARLALARSYAHPIAAEAPRLRSVRLIAPATFEIIFEHAGGLMIRGGRTADGFAVAGEDRVFYPATAELIGERLRVACPAVARPVAVRFAWDELAMPNLVNGAGLPALPFRTDDWPLALEVPKP